MYTVKLQLVISFGGDFLWFEKKIELPFPPYNGLVVRVSDEQSVRLDTVEWDMGKEEFVNRSSISPGLSGLPEKSEDEVIEDFGRRGWVFTGNKG